VVSGRAQLECSRMVKRHHREVETLCGRRVEFPPAGLCFPFREVADPDEEQEGTPRYSCGCEECERVARVMAT
jgi:hypothetical protein